MRRGASRRFRGNQMSHCNGIFSFLQRHVPSEVGVTSLPQYVASVFRTSDNSTDISRWTMAARKHRQTKVLERSVRS